MDTARRMYETRPVYTLDHLIKERYPRFTDALGDLDDALSMLHLFASFPAEPPIKPEITATAKRLCREWQYYCARSRSLRKVFFSIKGVYYQAEVASVTVTWLAPWQFSQALPCDVDYKVMLTFLELHEVRFFLISCCTLLALVVVVVVPLGLYPSCSPNTHTQITPPPIQKGPREIFPLQTLQRLGLILSAYSSCGQGGVRGAPDRPQCNIRLQTSWGQGEWRLQGGSGSGPKGNRTTGFSRIRYGENL